MSHTYTTIRLRRIVIGAVTTVGLLSVSLTALASPARATSPGYVGRLLITYSHPLFEGRTRSDISLKADGTGFTDYTSKYAAAGLINTQKLYHTFDGGGFVGSKGYADFGVDAWYPWPSLPLVVEFDFTVCRGNRFYFRSTGPLADGWYIYSMKLDGSDLRQVATVDARGLSCSPDGTKIAFVGSPPNTGTYGGDLYTINIDGTNVIQMTTGRSLHVDGAVPSWSPDGRTIAYTINAGSPADSAKIGIWTIDVATKQETRIYDLTNTLARPVFSPDGQSIAVYSNNAGDACRAPGHGVCMMDADGSNLRSFPFVEDPYGGSTAFATSWAPILNQAPIITGTSVQTANRTAVTVDVFTDATDEEILDPANVSVAVQPSHGSASVNASNGTLTYTPADTFAGTDQLTYEVCDSFDLDQKCATAVLGITVQAAAPTPTPIAAPTPTPSAPTVELKTIGTLKTVANAHTYYYTGHRPTFSGTSTPGASITVEIHSDPVILTTTADSSGNWSVTPTQELPTGEHTVTISASMDGITTTLDSFVLGINTGLAATGSPMWPLAVVGLIGLVSGRLFLKRRYLAQ